MILTTTSKGGVWLKRLLSKVSRDSVLASVVLKEEKDGGRGLEGEERDGER
jgi:hypothetical protein